MALFLLVTLLPKVVNFVTSIGNFVAWSGKFVVNFVTLIDNIVISICNFVAWSGNLVSNIGIFITSMVFFYMSVKQIVPYTVHVYLYTRRR